ASKLTSYVSYYLLVNSEWRTLLNSIKPSDYKRPLEWFVNYSIPHWLVLRFHSTKSDRLEACSSSFNQLAESFSALNIESVYYITFSSDDFISLTNITGQDFRGK